jgi:hypothetical protein
MAAKHAHVAMRVALLVHEIAVVEWLTQGSENNDHAEKLAQDDRGFKWVQEFDADRKK